MIIFLLLNPYDLFGDNMTPTQTPTLETHPACPLTIPHLISQPH